MQPIRLARELDCAHAARLQKSQEVTAFLASVYNRAKPARYFHTSNIARARDAKKKPKAARGLGLMNFGKANFLIEFISARKFSRAQLMRRARAAVAAESDSRRELKQFILRAI